MDPNEESDEPMEIDISTNSIKKEIDSFYPEQEAVHEIQDLIVNIKLEKDNNDGKDKLLAEHESDVDDCIITKTEVSNVRRYHINYQKYSSNRKVVISALTVLTLSILIYILSSAVECSNELKVLNVKKMLEKKLHGQKNAITKVVKALESDTDNKLLFFYGGTGVGKTYTSSIIFGDLWNYTNIYHYTMPSFKDTFALDALIGLTFCQASVLVVDGLSGYSPDINPEIQHFFDKSMKLGRKATVILIYNCDVISNGFLKKCEPSFSQKLMKMYENVRVEKHFIKFENLKEPDLVKCIEKELNLKKVINYNVENIRKNFNVTLDGCKGVYQKIRSLNLL